MNALHVIINVTSSQIQNENTHYILTNTTHHTYNYDIANETFQECKQYFIPNSQPNELNIPSEKEHNRYVAG